jgi:hypothetical protein
MVLTVGMPSSGSEAEDPLTYIGCPVTLQQKKTAQFGRANQRWHFDTSTGLIEAFHTDTIDKGLPFNIYICLWSQFLSISK